MKQISFIHIADLHLDASFSSLADEVKAETRRNELENCFRSIVEKVRTTNSNLLIISGDLFEANNIKGSTVLMAKNLFSELYKTEIVICPGNHDPLNQNSCYKMTEWGSNVHILEDSQQVLYFEKYNTCIYNIGAGGNIHSDYNLVRNMAVSDDHFNILVFHGTVDMPFEEENYNPVSSEKLFSLGMDYVALGHMHCYSRLQNEKTVVINPSSPEPLGFDEEGAHGIIQGIIKMSDENEKTIETSFISTAKRHYHNADIDITGCESDDSVICKVRDSIKFSQNDLCSLTLKGFIPKGYQPGIKDIINILVNSCFYVKIKNQTAARFEYEEYLEDPGIKGEFVRRLMDLLDNETLSQNRETLFMALQYGLQAMENGKVE